MRNVLRGESVIMHRQGGGWVGEGGIRCVHDDADDGYLGGCVRARTGISSEVRFSFLRSRTSCVGLRAVVKQCCCGVRGYRRPGKGMGRRPATSLASRQSHTVCNCVDGGPPRASRILAALIRGFLARSPSRRPLALSFLAAALLQGAGGRSQRRQVVMAILFTFRLLRAGQHLSLADSRGDELDSRFCRPSSDTGHCFDPILSFPLAGLIQCATSVY